MRPFGRLQAALVGVGGCFGDDDDDDTNSGTSVGVTVISEAEDVRTERSRANSLTIDNCHRSTSQSGNIQVTVERRAGASVVNGRSVSPEASVEIGVVSIGIAAELKRELGVEFEESANIGSTLTVETAPFSFDRIFLEATETWIVGRAELAGETFDYELLVSVDVVQRPDPDASCGELIPVRAVELEASTWLDLDTGVVSQTPDSPGPRSDFEIVWVCGAGNEEALRLENRAIELGAEWAKYRVAGDLREIPRVDLLGASYTAGTNPETGYTDLFFEHASNVPVEGSTFFVKTAAGNYSKIQIDSYDPAQLNVCRSIFVSYQTYDLADTD